MNDNQLPPIADERLLAAMKAVNPPVEKLMADRLALRQEMKQAKDELERVRHHLIPRYICIVKAIVLGAATMALIALALALFKRLFEVKTTATLFASLLLPLWIVDQAERKFGRWIVHRDGRAEYLDRDGCEGL
ncbi:MULTISPECIES: hypothetical protein [unclassified Novosphingobium]|jgi:hypothetical protein|uniref:hypothetical protein n=1 Tax=unclassified Novosphingobium TaxID=2644732 RepID=UPI00086B6F99|nr:MULTISPECIES: hypothetical protein [unclassified Novosphingobium]MBN9146326.1 hypothetical protein [Novosphingobium sp.]ODU80078.1 MAG: hypothetical protein ABT10_19120 [Novosphingobium sp. SCN 63-17]OJX91493.1 MAG: hypothetical protein BGP00_05145 [Novosphingobium sp. 63-713]